MKLADEILGLWRLFFAGAFVGQKGYRLIKCPRKVVDTWMPKRTVILSGNSLSHPKDPPIKPLPTAKGRFDFYAKLKGALDQIDDSLNTGYEAQWFISPVWEESDWGVYFVTVDAPTTRNFWWMILKMRKEL